MLIDSESARMKKCLSFLIIGLLAALIVACGSSSDPLVFNSGGTQSEATAPVTFNFVLAQQAVPGNIGFVRFETRNPEQQIRFSNEEPLAANVRLDIPVSSESCSVFYLESEGGPPVFQGLVPLNLQPGNPVSVDAPLGERLAVVVPEPGSVQLTPLGPTVDVDETVEFAVNSAGQDVTGAGFFSSQDDGIFAFNQSSPNIGIGVSAGSTSIFFDGSETTPNLVLGAGSGGLPIVRPYDTTQPEGNHQSFFAFNTNYTGGINLGAADINDDGVQDMIVGAGQGVARVRVVNGSDYTADNSGTVGQSSVLADFFAYDLGFTGGVYVAAGDVNGDGISDIVTSASNGLAHVRVIDGTRAGEIGGVASGEDLLGNFFAFNTSFTGGANVAVGDVNDDGFEDIVVGTSSGAPQVRVIDGSKVGQSNGVISGDAILNDFFAFSPSFTGGVRVATGDVNGDGTADIITGAGSGGISTVRVFNGETSSVIVEFQFNGNLGSVAGTDANEDGFDDIVVGSGAGSPSTVSIFNGTDGSQIRKFNVFGGFQGGVSVAGSNVERQSFQLTTTVTVSTGQPRLNFIQAPTTAQTSTPLDYQVEVLDANGQRVLTPVNCLIRVAPDPVAPGSIDGRLDVVSNNGVATFNVGFDSGGVYRLEATANGFQSALSPLISVGR